MSQGQSLGETVRDWIQANEYVDFGLQVVVLVLFLLITLAAASGALYWLWWLVRLSNSYNVQDFTRKPIPGLRRGKVAGQEFELELARAESEAIRAIQQTIEDVNYRLEGVEGSVRKLAQALERFEDVSGRA